MKEVVHNPKHYATPTGEQVIDQMLKLYGADAVRWFCILNAYKYRMRAGKKGDADADIQKARWYENYVEYLNNCKDDLTKNH